MNNTHQEHQDKAQSLVDSFKPYVEGYDNCGYSKELELENARKCSHIAIDREIETVKEFRRKPQYAITMVLLNSKLSELQSIKELIDTTE